MNKIGASSLCTFLLYQSMNTGYKFGYTFDFLVAGSARTSLPSKGFPKINIFKKIRHPEIFVPFLAPLLVLLFFL